MAIKGITFVNQTVEAEDMGALYANIASDGRVDGALVSISGLNITIAPGYFIGCGRLFRTTSNTTLTSANSSGYARVVVTIDTTAASTQSEFGQVSFGLDYATSSTGFSALTQEDINNGGTTYQFAFVIATLSGGSISTTTAPLESAIPLAALASSATKLATARNINLTDADGSHSGTGAAFNGTAAVTLKLPSTIKASVVGNVTGNVTGNVSGTSGSTTGNAATATKLATARTVRTNLASTSTASFDGSANIAPGVTGTLPIANGGTGASSAAAARNALGLGNTSGALPVANGGTGAATASAALTNLGAAAASHTHAASAITGASTTLGAYTARRIYISTSTPSTSTGSIGDIWIKY